MIRILTILFIFAISIALISCDAPRLNPLDPQSPDYELGQLSGKVFERPHLELSGVNVIWKNQNILVQTDELGQYKITDLQMIDGTLYFEKNGYSNDSIHVTWNNQKIKQLEEKTLNFDAGQIKGSVKTESFPRQGISDVTVLWKNMNVITKTDANGSFSFTNIPYQNGWIYFEKKGYSGDSIFVEFNNQLNNISVESYLNTMPILNNLLLYTTVVNNNPSTKYITLEIRAYVNDNDGQSDIDTVYIKSNELNNFSKVLIYGGPADGYKNTFVPADLNMESFEEAIGRTFNIVVVDKKSRTFTLGSSTIKRIIKDEVSFDSPANNETTTSTPTFKWKRYLPGFNFSYSIFVYSLDAPQPLVLKKENISKDDLEYVFTTTLAKGNYFWRISCVDDFGDWSSSKPATFTVQ